MNSKVNSILALAVALMLLLAGCGSAAPSTPSAPSTPPAPPAKTAEPSQSAGSSKPAESSSTAVSEKASEETVMLHIGWADRFKTVEYTVKGTEPSPEILIAAISETTGWDLSLADKVIIENNRLVVSFAPGCALFTGPPDPQKDEYHVFDVEDLTFSILDSIAETLKKHHSPENPDNLDVYFCGKDNAPLVFPNVGGTGVTLPADVPYSHAELESLIAESNEEFEAAWTAENTPGSKKIPIVNGR